MNEALTDAEVWKESILIYIDNGYSRGEPLADVVAEVKSIVKNTELGTMDFSIDQIVEEWKADRGIA